MAVSDNSPSSLQSALNNGVLKRLPLTFLPFVNEQLHRWEHLFPNERQSVERLLLYVDGLTPQQSSALFLDVTELEEKMGVGQWQFSTSEQTIQNASQLARSPYFQDWRRAVQAVFDAADEHVQNPQSAAIKPLHRLVLLDIPQSLPLEAATAWRHWQGIGKIIHLDLNSGGQSQAPFEILLTGTKNAADIPTPGLLQTARNRPGTSAADTWLIDAARSLVDAALTQESFVPPNAPAVLLSNSRLDSYRENFSHEMNTMRKDLADADAVIDRLREVDVTPWCPPEVADYPAVREFVRSLFLSGNGAVIFCNSFVEWAASEAFRRARPSFLAARFGVRAKPKPFTGVAVFDNPDQVNPLPALDDLQGSAIDAQMLALYVWLAATRYEEYRSSTVCICIAESLSEAYVIAPPEFTFLPENGPVSLDGLGHVLSTWIA